MTALLWRARRREAGRRVAVGLVLLAAAGVGLGDDVRSEPEARLGARQVRLDLPHLGTTAVEIPRTTPTGVVLLMHKGASTAERAALGQAIPGHVLLVDVDVARFEGSGTGHGASGTGGPPATGNRQPATGADCATAADRLEDISRRAQRDAGLTRYHRPVIVATASALPVAATAIASTVETALPAAIAIGASIGDLDMACANASSRTTRTPSRWSHAASPLALRAPLEQALARAAAGPDLDGSPVSRWLQHFELPLTAAWSSHPRSMLVLLSPARGWREPEDALAQRLAAAGIHVVGIDALQSFWQRRSPSDVAFELRRLTDAVAATGLPVYLGGREFGAETMAVVGEMMAPDRRVAGIVLVDPGPTAFFEVEPPALALRPMSPRDWSTRAAVTRLNRPTLCVTHQPTSSAALLCGSLSGRGQATLARTANTTPALAKAIARFVLGTG